MTEIKTVTVQLRAPKEGDPGQVTYGYYTVKDGLLQMTKQDGRPLDNPLYSVRLHDGAPVEAIAANLTKSIRNEMRGEIVPGFSRELSYPKAYIA